MTLVLDHLVVLPVVLPLVVGAVLVFFDDRRRVLKASLSFATASALIVLSAALMVLTSGAEAGAQWSGVYLLGNWSPIFGIVLVADRVSALMLLLTAILGAAALSFASARWHRAGPHFHSLFLFLLMGINGAFLTGDLFNLFVFFEVMLGASYGLLLHGPTIARVKSGLHYIAINLVASLLFLIGVSLVYGVTGTLNMAELAVRVPQVADADRMLLDVGAAILGTAFLVKAGMWPLSFWLPTAYSAAAAPVAAIFAIMSKVGIYVIWRLSLLLFGEGAGASSLLGQTWIFYGGMTTIVFGSIGVLASQGMGRLAGFSVLVSSGTLLAAVGFGDRLVSSGALYYLVSSTLTISAFFLLIELVERGRVAGADILAVTMEAFGDVAEEEEDNPDEEVGVPIPATLAILGGSFLACALLLAGLPPFSGFIAKFAMMTGLFNTAGLGAGLAIPAGAAWLVGLLVVSGLAALVAMTRSGINTFWATLEDTAPRVYLVEIVPVVVLIGLCLLLAIFAGPAMAYLEATANELHSPMAYIDAVRTLVPVGAHNPGGVP